jgi:ferredoxin
VDSGHVNTLYDQLCRHDAAAWRSAIDAIAPDIHEVDRAATRIWFAFWPLELHLALYQGPGAERSNGPAPPADIARGLGLMGRWRLAEQVDESHRFLYAHRYWPQVKATVSSDRDWPEPLPALVAAVADAASRRARTDREMLLGMSAVALMTLRQVGPEAFRASPGQLHLSPAARRRSPRQVLRRRAKNDWQGLLGFMRGLKKRWTVTFDENDPGARFPLINGQEIATAARADGREYRSKEPRCTPGEGPIPVECRAASCGTCWVGVLAGAEKLSPVVDRDERKRMAVFGYCHTSEARPIIRLACQARAFGAVSVVIPPWNGFVGKIRDGDK